MASTLTALESTGPLPRYSVTKSKYETEYLPTIYGLLHLEQIIGSFAQTHCFPRAVAYLDSGKVKVKGMVCVYRIL